MEWHQIVALAINSIMLIVGFYIYIQNREDKVRVHIRDEDERLEAKVKEMEVKLTKEIENRTAEQKESVKEMQIKMDHVFTELSSLRQEAIKTTTLLEVVIAKIDKMDNK